MSIERRIARRYARAIVALIDEGKDLRAPLAGLAEVVRRQDIARLLASPSVPPEAKERALSKAFADLPKEMQALVRLLAKRNKLVLLPAIAEEVEAMLAAKSGEIEAEAISAIELNQAQQKRLQSAIEKATGKKVSLSVRVDPSILGGLVVRIGDRVIDASLRAQLEAMRRAILAAA